MRHILIHLLALMISTISPVGLRVARASDPPCEVCLSRVAVQRCAQDAQTIDAHRRRTVECQRALDASAGASAELRAQIDALHAVQRAEAARHAREVAELERRPRWRHVAIGVGAGVIVGVAVWEVVR